MHRWPREVFNFFLFTHVIYASVAVLCLGVMPAVEKIPERQLGHVRVFFKSDEEEATEFCATVQQSNTGDFLRLRLYSNDRCDRCGDELSQAGAFEQRIELVSQTACKQLACAPIRSVSCSDHSHTRAFFSVFFVARVLFTAVVPTRAMPRSPFAKAYPNVREVCFGIRLHQALLLTTPEP